MCRVPECLKMDAIKYPKATTFVHEIIYTEALSLNDEDCDQQYRIEKELHNSF
jgi:hypothetical protein